MGIWLLKSNPWLSDQMYVLGMWNLLLTFHRQSVCIHNSAKPGVSLVLSAFSQFEGLAQVAESLTYEQPRPGGLEVEKVRRVSATDVPGMTC